MTRSVRALFSSLSCSVLIAGCGISFGGDQNSVTGENSCVVSDYGNINNGELPEGCIKTEGGDHGKLMTLAVGSSSIEFTSWLSKNPSGEGEYVGFTYVAPAGTFISIKAGGESYLEDGDGVWVNPNGTTGDKASAISNIVICESAPDENNPGCTGNDSDGDGRSDDVDEDNDGSPDNEDGEFAGLDTDRDGLPDLLDDDDDNDGIPDPQDPDRDGDGTPDDGDGNNDGVSDAQDPSPTGEPDPVGGDGQCSGDSECGPGSFCSGGVCINV